MVDGMSVTELVSLGEGERRIPRIAPKDMLGKEQLCRDALTPLTHGVERREHVSSV